MKSLIYAFVFVLAIGFASAHGFCNFHPGDIIVTGEVDHVDYDGWNKPTTRIRLDLDEAYSYNRPSSRITIYQRGRSDRGWKYKYPSTLSWEEGETWRVHLRKDSNRDWRVVCGESGRTYIPSFNTVTTYYVGPTVHQGGVHEPTFDRIAARYSSVNVPIWAR